MCTGTLQKDKHGEEEKEEPPDILVGQQVYSIITRGFRDEGLVVPALGSHNIGSTSTACI
jgi:hypothetical protein